MAAGLNKIILIGHLGKDPEMKQLNSGAIVTNFSLAVAERVKDSPHTEWFDVSCFGTTAQAVARYVKKGRQVYVEGRLNIRKWTAKDGTEKSTLSVTANLVHFLGTAADRPQQEDSDDDLIEAFLKKPQAPMGRPTIHTSDDDLPF